jgi:hypothetical protein
MNNTHNHTPSASARDRLLSALYKIVAALQPSAPDGAVATLVGGGHD